jgi:hypothetical protein
MLNISFMIVAISSRDIWQTFDRRLNEEGKDRRVLVGPDAESLDWLIEV